MSGVEARLDEALANLTAAAAIDYLESVDQALRERLERILAERQVIAARLRLLRYETAWVPRSRRQERP